jgi:hypothetical protein
MMTHNDLIGTATIATASVLPPAQAEPPFERLVLVNGIEEIIGPPPK